MKVLKGKRAKELLSKYENSKFDDIYKAYKKPSSEKVLAYNEILKEMEELGGYGMRITGKGMDYFSCAYRLDNYLIYHTYANIYKVIL